jgi:hypothetical protein
MVVKKSVKKKTAAKKKVAVKKAAATKKRVKNKTSSVTNSRKKADSPQQQVIKMSKASVRKKGISPVQAQIPPGFQSGVSTTVEEEPPRPEPVLHEAKQRTHPYATPSSHWSHLEPAEPQPKHEIVVEVEEVTPLTLIEQVLLDSEQTKDETHPFNLQPRFQKNEIIEEDMEEQTVTAIASASRATMASDYLGLWSGERETFEPELSAAEVMVASTTVAEAPAEAEQAVPVMDVAEEIPEETEDEEVAESVAILPEEELQPLPAFFAPQPEEEAEEEDVLPQLPENGPESFLVEPVEKPRTSMLDAVHALATEAARKEVEPKIEQAEAEPEESEPSHTEQVAEAIRMIEEEDAASVEEQAAATVADEPSVDTDAPEEESERDSEETPHFDEALDKIAGTRSGDTLSAQRREAIRHFTDTKVSQKRQRRNRVEPGAPGVVVPQPPSAKVEDRSVAVENLGGGVLNLFTNGVKGVLNIGRYSAAGVKYGLQDSKSALKNLTSKS